MAVVFRDDQYLPIQGMYGSTWRGDVARAGAGTLLEHSIHDLDMLRFLLGPVVDVSARTNATSTTCPASRTWPRLTLRFSDGALARSLSVWHDNLARPSLRRVEVFCERRHIVVDGDDWFGPVRWTDADGTHRSLEGAPLARAAAPLVPGPTNPDEAFLVAAERRRAGLARLRGWPRGPPGRRCRLPIGGHRRRARGAGGGGPGRGRRSSDSASPTRTTCAGGCCATAPRPTR